MSLLSELDDIELTNIWTQCLRMDPEDESFAEGNDGHKVKAISKEWRSVHGHSLVNLFRDDHELPWKHILIDVADKLTPGIFGTDFYMDDEHPEEDIERKILELVDQLIKEKWKNMSKEERKKMVDDINESLKSDQNIISAKGSKANKVQITVKSLSSGVSAGLLVGGGALMVAQSTAAGVVVSLVGMGVLTQIGFWVVVNTLGWWSGAKALIFGSAATLGGTIVAAPVVLVAGLNIAMSTSYKKSIPATIAFLCAHEMRRQLAAKGVTG